MKKISREEAIAAGINRFFTDIPCRNGHVCQRIASTNKCVECQKENLKRYNIAHPDRTRARNLRWQRNNREKVREHTLRWNSKNPDKCRARLSRWYRKCADNPDKVKERSLASKQWAKNNPEKRSAYSCKWQVENPIKAAAIQNARRARKLGAKGRYTKSDIDKLFMIQDGKCALSWCRKSIKTKKHVDHIIPLAGGGSNEPDNLQLLCPTCNCRKGTKHPIVFAQENGMLL